MNKDVILTILSNDPGASAKNPGYGVAVVQVCRYKNKLKCRILKNGVIPISSTINQLKDSKLYCKQREAYLDFMNKIFAEYPIQAIVAERYMSRGAFAGATGEYIAHMLSALSLTYKRLPIKWMSAASWKNAIRRAGIDLKQTYKICRTKPHQLDACLQGIWAGCFAFGAKDFGDLDMKKLLPKLLDQIEATSAGPLHNRRIQRK